MRYRPEIDGLRAIAVVPVILFHAGFSAFSGGFVGVDVFFVISGFLITNIIHREIAAGNFSIARFYERRARRILPALYLICLACIPFACLWMLPRDLRDFSQSLVAVNLFASNILFWLESGYFETAAGLKPLLHTWSLAIEEQFYIFFPIFLFLVRKLSHRSLFVLIGVLSLGSLAIAEYGSRLHPVANFFLLPSRAWELGIGAMMALAIGDGRVGTRPIREIGSLAGLGLITFAVFGFDETIRFPSVWALVPVGGTALVIACSGGGDLAGRVLGWRPVVAIGLVSYSAYLWHHPLFAFARLRSLEPPTTGLYLALIAATFVLAFLSWRFVEAPFRNRRATSVRRLAAFAAPAAAAMLAVGVWGHATDGFRWLAPDAIRNIEEKLAANYGLSPACGEYPVSDACRTSDRPDVVVWGDSYAMQLVDGIIASDPGMDLVQRTMSVCGPVLDMAPVVYPDYAEAWAADCLNFNEDTFAYLLDTPSIKHAILSANFRSYLGEDAIIISDGSAFEPNIRLVARSIADTVMRLAKIGIQSTVVAPIPSVGDDIGRCLAKSISVNVSINKCLINYRDYQEYDRDTIYLFAILSKMGISTIKPSDYLCNGTYCDTYEAGIFLYRDDGHISMEGSSYLGRKLDFARLMTGHQIANRPARSGGEEDVARSGGSLPDGRAVTLHR